MSKTIRESFEGYFSSHKKTMQPLLQAYSEKAFEGLASAAWPSRSLENWKYTSTNKIQSQDWKLPSSDKAAYLQSLASSFVNKITISNGEVNSHLPDGVVFKSWQDMDIDTISNFHKEAGDSMDLLFKSVGYIGGVLEFTSSYKEVDTFYIEHLCDQVSASQVSSVKINIHPDIKVNLLEAFIVGEEAFVNRKLNVDVGERSVFNYQSLVDSKGFNFGRSNFNVAQSASLNTAEFGLSGLWTRMETTATTAGEQSNINLNGFISVKEKNHCDWRTEVNHKFPHGFSRQSYKYLADDKATAVFNGKIFIEKQAQKIDSAMINRNLLMAKGAQVFTKPELEVYADDVSANHGTTTGQLEETELFYLQSRGIPKRDAVKLLQKGFAGSCLEVISDPLAKKLISQKVNGVF